MLISLGISSLLIGGFNLAYQSGIPDRIVQKDLPEAAGIAVASIGAVYVDEQGVVTDQKPGNAVPAIDALISAPEIGDRIADQSVRSVLGTIVQFDRAYLAVEHATIYNENYIEYVVTDQVKVVSTHVTDPFYVVSTVQSIRKAYEIEGRSIDVIDVRFNKPFVIERYGP